MSQTLLIVDDDVSIRGVLTRILELEGYSVLTAASFEAGRAALEDALPDMLIVDVRLGEFNGLQLLATAARTIPAIVMTGHDDVTLKRAAYQFGAEYFVKPVPAEVLLASIRRQLLADRTHDRHGAAVRNSL